MNGSPDDLRIEITPVAIGFIVRMVGEIDLQTSPVLRDRLIELLDNKPSRVILDLAGVPYVDSSGVGTFVDFKRRAERAGSKAVLAGLQPRVLNLFEITRLTTFFTITASVDDAERG